MSEINPEEIKNANPPGQITPPVPRIETQQTVRPPVLEDMHKVVNNIADMMAIKSVEASVTKDSTAPQANTPMLFDLANMSPEQLQTLKAMLNVTPDRAQQKRGNIRVKIRTISQNEVPRYIVDFKRARTALAYATETGKEFESHRIEVLLNGDTAYTDMMYPEFMEAERVAVEVISQREEKDTLIEGEVVQRETGKLINKEVNIVKYFYTVKLPDGTTAELQGSLANA